MPALVNVCAKGVVKAGKSVFKFKGKDYEVKVDKPLTSNVDQPASSSPAKASYRPKTCRTKRVVARDLKPRKDWMTPAYDPPVERIIHRTCDGEGTKQAYYNYSSIISRRPDLASLTCPSYKYPRPARPQVDKYNQQHHTDWNSGWLRSSNLECQRDEYPGAAIWQARDSSVWIRLIPRTENAKASYLFVGCPDQEEEQLVTEISITTTDPETLVDGPGFALLTNDPWYTGGSNRDQFMRHYAQVPSAQFINGRVNRPTWGWTRPNGNNGGGRNNTPDPDSDSDDDMPDAPSDDEDNDPTFPGGRSALDELNEFKRSPNELVVHEGNSTRGIRRGNRRRREMEELGFASLPVVQEMQKAPVAVHAEATPTDGSAVIEAKATPVRMQEADVSVITPAPRHPHYRYE
ncbi:hypothetical protein COCSADRAFT_177985 [Bipolaris sorokiniana ND90Pr]|uniref:Uncharacterized protein n=1 Tax=Cochliobolus sativus (strain ND90Pr / ATCC 201652) TaxID=665912 RepID=M2T0N4_COCSN|nr:uncharacterized protein COCSADRAFT_177985 [Bipolaris sorokiniana ND90Pr]EMD68085.1 hypothetical protein COCSADRAFT_177985 [Bipolaris sorokiniana ND90Pr]